MKNLIKLYSKMTETEITQGMVWYYSANEFAQFLANKYGVHTHRVAGIIAALSPACSWARNKLEAEWLICCNLEDYETEPFNFTTYGANVVKAQRIYAGEKFEYFNEKTDPKTFNFYWNILEPFNPDYLTVDRHCYYTAMGKRIEKGITPKQYRDIAEHYKKTAKKLNILPNQLQAILWLGVQNNLI